MTDEKPKIAVCSYSLCSNSPRRVADFLEAHPEYAFIYVRKLNEQDKDFIILRYTKENIELADQLQKQEPAAIHENSVYHSLCDPSLRHFFEARGNGDRQGPSVMILLGKNCNATQTLIIVPEQLHSFRLLPLDEYGHVQISRSRFLQRTGTTKPNITDRSDLDEQALSELFDLARSRGQTFPEFVEEVCEHFGQDDGPA